MIFVCVCSVFELSCYGYRIVFCACYVHQYYCDQAYCLSHLNLGRTYQYQRFLPIQKRFFSRDSYELETQNAGHDRKNFVSLGSIYHWILSKSLFVALFVWSLFYYLVISKFRKSKPQSSRIYVFDYLQPHLYPSYVDYCWIGRIWSD